MQTLFPSENPFGSSQDTINHTTLSRWEQLREYLRQTLDPKVFWDWIEPMKAKASSVGEVVVTLPNMVFYQGVIDNFLDKFEHAKSILGIELLVSFEIAGASKEVFEEDFAGNRIAMEMSLSENERAAADVADEYSNPNQSPVSRALSTVSHLNNEYRFETFVNGPSNQFAHASCLAVADAPGQAYNPLFLYGSTGLGKTHLLHAVGNRVLAKRKNAVVTYITSERFMNEMIYCIRNQKMHEFRRKYRNCDLLLVDDIQFISKKERTQEEFFHTFNALYEAKKQIVVTSDIFPQDIPDIEDRLRNRFQWGLIADIQPPDVEHRMAILMNKAEKQGLRIDPEVVHYIAHHAKGSVRVLEGALSRVSAFATLQGRPIDLRLASEVLQNVFGETPRRLTIEVIQKIVSDHFKIKVSDLKSKKRQRAFSVPRQIAMFLSRSRTNASFPEIGAKFGGKDHTTVMHAVKKIEVDRVNDIEIRTSIESLERKLDQQC